MALVKRGKTWHTHFFVDGHRFRQSLGTNDWRVAQAREKELITQATQGSLDASHHGFAKLAFTGAAESYFNGRKLELSESSRKKERQLLVRPCEFFQQKCLSKITSEDVLRFREWRSKSGVGPAVINMEVGVIRRMLKRARRWNLIGADIQPLKEPRSIGRALTVEEKLRLLRSRPKCGLAACRGCDVPCALHDNARMRTQKATVAGHRFAESDDLDSDEQDGSGRKVDSDERRNSRNHNAPTGTRKAL